MDSPHLQRMSCRLAPGRREYKKSITGKPPMEAPPIGVVCRLDRWNAPAATRTALSIRACFARPASNPSRCAMLRPTSGFARVLEHLRHMVPVDQMLDERLEIVGPPVAIVDVVGVLPDVAAENGRRSVHQRILAIGRLHHGDRAVLDGDPAAA